MATQPGTPVSWAVEGDLDIFSLQDQTSQIKALLDPKKGLTIDLGRLGDLDPSGLQLLLSLRSSLTARNQPFQIIGVPDKLRERMLDLGVRDLFPEGSP